jgi:hypothetical protein
VIADKDNENILAKEVESWEGIEYALCNPNTTTFNKMLTDGSVIIKKLFSY